MELGRSLGTSGRALLVIYSLAGCHGPRPPAPTPSPTPAPSAKILTPSFSARSLPTATPSPATPPPTLTPAPTATPTPTQTPTPLPTAFIPYSRLEVGRLFSGFQLRTRIVTEEGASALIERKTPSAYALDLEVQLKVPRAALTMTDLQLADPQLQAAFPALPTLLPTAKVSQFFHTLYQLKIDLLNRDLSRLDTLVSRHNFFDCNTVLELMHPQSGRKVLLIQSDMDVNADGSDADRFSGVDGSSTDFQPFTSYRWAKKTDRPSQFLAEREARLQQEQTEYEAKTTASDRKKVLKEQLGNLEREIADLKRFSFLISKADPYIVLPGFMLRQNSYPYQPRLGDLAVVIHKGKLYPALLGDVGPSYKMGEASLRLAAQLDPKANAYVRPNSDLNITYLLFPGSAEALPGPPDLVKLRQRCEVLLGEIGGFAGELWNWTDILATPTPTPTPSPSPAPVIPAPSSSPSPRSSPSPAPS